MPHRLSDCINSVPLSNFDQIGTVYSFNVATPYGADDMEMNDLPRYLFADWAKLAH